VRWVEGREAVRRGAEEDERAVEEVTTSAGVGQGERQVSAGRLLTLVRKDNETGGGDRGDSEHAAKTRNEVGSIVANFDISSDSVHGKVDGFEC
jgi:hypothetical protein